MKKMIFEDDRQFIRILDSKDYIIIEEDDQHISDKYVDIKGNKINEYNDSDSDYLEEGDLIIRQIYYIGFDLYVPDAIFKYFKYYNVYDAYSREAHKLKPNLGIGNSVFDFDFIKDILVRIFTLEVNIEPR